MTARAHLALLALSAALAAPSAAAAADPALAGPPPQQNPTDARALAETLFFTARGLIEANRYPEACAKLTESYRLDPAAGTLLNLAVCNEKIGRIASAWGEFRESIALARQANRADREKLCNDHIAAIEPELPFLAIKVPAELRAIPGLEILRNGIPLQAGAWDTDLPVDPGRVEVVERAPGYKPKLLYTDLVNKQHAVLTAEPLELAPVVRPPPPFWTARRQIGVVLFGAGLVAAGVGTYFGVQALNDKRSSDGACPSDAAGVQRCTQAGVDAMNSARTEAWIADVTLGVGAAAGILGAVLFATGGTKESASPTTAGWSWRIEPAPAGARGVLAASF